MEAKYQQYSENSGSDFESNTELRIGVNATIEGDIVRAFGSSSEYGDSLGVVFEEAALLDGGLYLDAAKGRYKVFSWKEITGFNVFEHLERGNELSAEDADEVLSKTYNEEKTYELIGARVPEEVDEDGDVVVEGSSVFRDYAYDGPGTVPEFDEPEDLEGSDVYIGDVIVWFGGTSEYGPSASARRLAELLTTLGSEAVLDENNIYDWLADTSGTNILRDDLQDRRIRYFVVRRQPQEGKYPYNYPVLEDVNTGEEVVRDNSASPEGEGDDSGNW